MSRRKMRKICESAKIAKRPGPHCVRFSRLNNWSVEIKDAGVDVLGLLAHPQPPPQPDLRVSQVRHVRRSRYKDAPAMSNAVIKSCQSIFLLSVPLAPVLRGEGLGVRSLVAENAPHPNPSPPSTGARG
jgi:hypothetical protein